MFSYWWINNNEVLHNSPARNDAKTGTCHFQTLLVHCRPYENRQRRFLLTVAVCNHSLHNTQFPSYFRISRSFLLLWQKGSSSLAAQLHGAQKRTADTIKLVNIYSTKVLNVETDALFTTSHHFLLWLSGIFSTSWYFCFFPCGFLGVDTFCESILIFRPSFSHLSTAFYL